MVDLHSHTTASDGSYSPERLVAAAMEAGIETLSITDHDSFDGYEAAVPVAESAGFDLIRGIELSTRRPDSSGRAGASVHILGYFPGRPPSPDFLEWLGSTRRSRRDRNRQMAARLAELGVEITIDEVEALGGPITGRPHFARVMLEKGYVGSYQEAFRRYLDETAPGYVHREEPPVAEGIKRIRSGGGIPVAAHPVRLNMEPETEEDFVRSMRDHGLQGLEVHHSDHQAADVSRYQELSRRYGLVATGGSDFHGDYKPNVALGVGPGHVNVPRAAVSELRRLAG